MQPRPTRRFMLQGALAGACLPYDFSAATAHAGDPAAEIADLEARLGGRIGVAALDAGTKQRILYRAGERSP